jgi:hypothetical protein
MRASDADRDATAAFLRENLAEGRLTMTEFDERLEAAYAAKTYADLDMLLTDLPRRDSFSGSRAVTVSDTGMQLAERWNQYRLNRNRRRWSRFVSVNAFLWAVWGIYTIMPGHHGEDLWPLFVTVPWGALLVSRRAHPFACHRRDKPAGSGHYL